MTGLPVEIDLVLRLLLASAVGAVIGFERERHGHPAGMRTHLLVAVGSAIFTVLSFHAFGPISEAPVDGSRVAAQIVAGVGFLGAGAIMKDGLSIRGLTTAASLWAVAALGISAAVGQVAVTAAGTAIVLVSLSPLRRVETWIRRFNLSTVRVRVQVETVSAIGPVVDALRAARMEVGTFTSQRTGTGRVQADINVRRPGAVDLFGVLAALEGLPGVDVVGVDEAE